MSNPFAAFAFDGSAPPAQPAAAAKRARPAGLATFAAEKKSRPWQRVKIERQVALPGSTADPALVPGQEKIEQRRGTASAAAAAAATAGAAGQNSLVSCPVCGHNVPSLHINAHVDECLRGGAAGGAPNTAPESKAGSEAAAEDLRRRIKEKGAEVREARAAQRDARPILAELSVLRGQYSPLRKRLLSQRPRTSSRTAGGVGGAGGGEGDSAVGHPAAASPAAGERAT